MQNKKTKISDGIFKILENWTKFSKIKKTWLNFRLCKKSNHFLVVYTNINEY